MRGKVIVLLVTLILSESVKAKDFGTRGHINKIVEQPFLQMIHERLQKVDMEKERQKMTAIAKERLENPLPVKDITPAKKGRIFFFDPTYVLGEDAVLPCGKVLYKAGTSVNPLEYIQLDRRLFFIDSRQKEQVKWLQKQLNQEKQVIENRIILVGGSPLSLEKELDEIVYFDQQGALSGKFGIKHSPAVVEQDGKILRIEEIKLKQ